MTGNSTCEPPAWRMTRKGRHRCGRVCTDEHGKRRFRWAKGAECSGLVPPTLPPSSTTGPAPVEALAKALGVPPMKLKPLGTMPLGQSGTISGDEPGDESGM